MKNLKILLMSLLILTLLFNCRSRKKIREVSELNRKETLKIDSQSTSVKKDSVIKKTEEKKTEFKKVDRNDGEIIIKGKTDSIKPFEFYNIIKGDTISSISITGNADFEIKNNWGKSNTKTELIEKTEDLNIVSKTARDMVSKETIKKVAEEVKNVRTEVKTNGLPPIVYIIGGVILLVCGALYVIITTYKKKP